MMDADLRAALRSLDPGDEALRALVARAVCYDPQCQPLPPCLSCDAKAECALTALRDEASR